MSDIFANTDDVNEAPLTKLIIVRVPLDFDPADWVEGHCRGCECEGQAAFYTLADSMSIEMNDQK